MRNRRGLKPCPWCGSVPILVEDKLWSEHSYNGRTITHGYVGAYNYYYMCSNDECRATAPHGTFNDIYRTTAEAKEKAREAWDRRTNHEIDI